MLKKSQRFILGVSPEEFLTAAEKGDLATAESYVATHRNDRDKINVKDPRDKTAFMLAFSRNHINICNLLLNLPNFDASGHLTWAASMNYVHVLTILLTRPGIDVNARDIYRDTALDTAAEKNHHQIVTLLLADPHTNVNARNRNGKTALDTAAERDHHQIVTLLLADPRINVNATDGNGVCQESCRNSI